MRGPGQAKFIVVEGFTKRRSIQLCQKWFVNMVNSVLGRRLLKSANTALSAIQYINTAFFLFFSAQTGLNYSKFSILDSSKIY